MLAGLLASVFVVNPVAALGVASAAHAEPDPDQQKVVTQSGKTGCLVGPAQVLCGGTFANAPTHDGYPDHVVWIEADGGGLQWNDSNMPSTGSFDAKYDLVLTYDQVFHLKGWTIEPGSAGTRFTNDETGHGMFVRTEGVTSF